MKKTKIIILLISVSLLFAGVANAKSKIKLFNCKNLEGWYAYAEVDGKHKDAADIFQVDKHMIRLSGSQAGYLMSEQSFHDFQLTLEFRWNSDSTFIRKNNSKNSGIMYLVPSDTRDRLWPQGIQFQVKEGATGDFILLQEVTLEINGTVVGPGGSVVSKRFNYAAKPIGEWNTVVITVKDGLVKQELNGMLVNEGIKPSVNEGRILLQYEGYPIDFRKIVLEELD